jgi:outer membrane lipoprotein-sorting protein
MNIFSVALAATLALSATPAPAAPGAALLKRMLQLNAGLRTYQATVHLDVALKTFPYISPSLSGNVYYKKPDKQAVVFDTVPALASEFKRVYPKIDPPAQWPALYAMTVLSDEGGATTFRLVPKKQGRVDHLDVKVDDATATVKGYSWNYRDGGFVTFAQTFKTVGGDYLVDKQTGHVELPSYKADVKSSFSNYKLNVPIADSVFVEH